MRYKQRIPVYFETPYVGELFIDCPFITRISSNGQGRSVMTSRAPQRTNKHESDYEAWHRIVNGIKYKFFYPYVDKPNTKELRRRRDKLHVAVVHGCLNSGKLMNRKSVTKQFLQYAVDVLLNNNVVPVLIGSLQDKRMFWDDVNKTGCVDFVGKLNIRDSVSLLSQCDFFVSNDTGLYHVAGALDMRGIVLWNKTDFYKNLSPCNTINHVHMQKGNAKSIYKLLVKRLCV